MTCLEPSCRNWMSWYQYYKIDLDLITDRPHHWTLRHRMPISHLWTFFINSAKCSGSDFNIWSNSANLPGRKNTFVSPNLKSTSFKPSALNEAYSTIRNILTGHLTKYLSTNTTQYSSWKNAGNNQKTARETEVDQEDAGWTTSRTGQGGQWRSVQLWPETRISAEWWCECPWYPTMAKQPKI